MFKDPMKVILIEHKIVDIVL